MRPTHPKDDTMNNLITVFGATGAQGGGLARAILADPQRRFRVRASPASPTRRPRNAGERRRRSLRRRPRRRGQRRPGDAGAHGAFCVTNFWEHFSPRRSRAGAHDGAGRRRAGGQHVIWSTLEDTRDVVPLDGSRMPVLMGEYNVPHFDGKGEANRAFFDHGVPTTLLYTSFYWDNLIHFGMAPKRGADGTLAFVLPMGDAKLPGIAAEDIGRAPSASSRAAPNSPASRSASPAST
jgi:hypothetical protein